MTTSNPYVLPGSENFYVGSFDYPFDILGVVHAKHHGSGAKPRIVEGSYLPGRLAEVQNIYELLSESTLSKKQAETISRIDQQIGEINRGLIALGASQNAMYRDLMQRIENKRRSPVEDEGLVPDDAIGEDPYMKWCRENSSMLAAIVRERGDCFLAIDIERGVIELAEPDQEEFIRKFEMLNENLQRTLYRVHSSMFV